MGIDLINSKNTFNSNNMTDNFFSNNTFLNEQEVIDKRSLEPYTRMDFQREVFGVDIIELTQLLEYKKNIILQGAPGVGKT